MVCSTNSPPSTVEMQPFRSILVYTSLVPRAFLPNDRHNRFGYVNKNWPEPERIISLKPSLDQIFRKAIDAHQTGELEEARRYYMTVLKAQPDHSHANHNLGVMALRADQPNEALVLLQKALMSNPTISQFWLTYLNTLLKLNNFNDANAVLRRATKMGFNGKEYDQIKFKISSYSKENVMSLPPNEPAKEKLQKLLTIFSKGEFLNVFNEVNLLLNVYPNSYTLHNLIGAAQYSLKQVDAAIINYTNAIKLNPNFAAAYFNLGNALRSKGNLQAALENYYMSIKLNPDFPDAYKNFGQVLRFVEFTGQSKNMQEAIATVFGKHTYVNPKATARPALSLLKFEDVLNELFEVSSDQKLKKIVKKSIVKIVTDLSELTLLMKMMRLIPLPDLQFERLLVIIREALLFAILDLKDNVDILSFQSALALHCFTNEYVFKITKSEQSVIHDLEVKVEQLFNSKAQPSSQLILCLASYKSLNSYKWSQQLIGRPDIMEVVTRQVIEPSWEDKIKPNIASLGEIKDKVSSIVRNQYEINPYPRWVKLRLPLKPKKIQEITQDIQLKIFDFSIMKTGKPSILIAGCGTGEHSLVAARRFKDCKVLAVDLSLSSLAYAKRKTDEEGLTNIEYMQADILQLEKLGKKFDIIESSGVLHHMADPIKGWNSLVECLKSGGLIKVGLYSKLARQNIVKLRKQIENEGIGFSPNDIRIFRSNLIKKNAARYRSLYTFLDFYCMSEVRDLLFHSTEHQFTLPQIQKSISALSLSFCGFENQRIVASFKQIYTHEDDPYDLSLWHSFETKNPTTFSAMYQFWSQKVT